MSTNRGTTKAANDADSEYDSAEDADFKDSESFSGSSSDESDAPKRKKKLEKDLNSGDELTIAKQRKKRRKDTDADDLILTRAQKRAKYVSIPDLSKNLGRMKLNPWKEIPLRRIHLRILMPYGNN